MCEFVPVVDVYMARRVINSMLLYRVFLIIFVIYFRHFYNSLFCLIRLAQFHRLSAIRWHAITSSRFKWNFLHRLTKSC